MFIVQIAALSWATIQPPEIAAAIQRLLNAGFRSAAQAVMIGDDALDSLQRCCGCGVSEFYS